MSLGSLPGHDKPLDRKQMEAVIAQGQSVLYGGRILVHATHLPSDAELAAQSGDPIKEAVATRQLQDQIARLQTTLDDLTSGKFRRPAEDRPRDLGPEETPAAPGPAGASPAPGAAPVPQSVLDAEHEARRALLAGAESPAPAPAPGPAGHEGERSEESAAKKAKGR